MRLHIHTRRTIREVFERLDYRTLGRIYCDEGGEAFWRDRRGPCQRLGVKLAEALRGRLTRGGRSLYVGAGVAELPALLMESLERGRSVVSINLRKDEVRILNEACRDLPIRFRPEDAASVRGRFDHLWMVSVLNDPERFPELSALSYGRANPVFFSPTRFMRERHLVRRLATTCLRKLTIPGLVTTSVEEISWVMDWCGRRGISCVVQDRTYPTALVGDPVCLITIGKKD